ncbi:cation diffusion facilitator family transporter [Cryobacterium sp. MP_M5]|uniref:cation diffusion facilitator family transporter n=1 Tax=unclassified Cryobacterium TaxID=2649013 RepID=UPI0018C9AA98|nr:MULTISPECIES: cation diffusion facilitator family transporter [unclassified Cryobacterium]MBG6058184.1 cation diffusion facilitator family transporter [Cryobacterium sp. MP_M3]MEC5176572.1 cation diffusion facilitator family transporter [Cryobacterium sp. MP_M5]
MSAPHAHSPGNGLPGDADTHEHEHEHERDHEHEHGHDHGHGHEHPTGVAGFFYGLFVPHSHDAADSIDDALEASTQGIRAVKISLLILLGTTILQFAVVLLSGSVALLADTIHNFSDALTAIPLWIAFILGRRIASRRYTYGYGRAEDLAGLFIVGVVALSAVVAAWQSIGRLFNPQPLHNLWWVLAAGLIGFAGNELVAIYRIRVGQQIGSAALVADGVHARIDGFTSLAVVAGALGVMLGFPLADPIVGLLISAAIIVLLWGTVRSIGQRLMDGIEPELVDRARSALAKTPGVLDVSSIRLRWVGHRLRGEARVTVADTLLSAAVLVADNAERQVQRAMPNLDHFAVQTVTAVSSSGER